MLKIIETSEKKYRNLHENMHEGAISIDRSGCFIECNSSFLRLTRYNKKELSKVNYWEMTSSAWRSDEEYTLLEKLWPTGLTQKYEKKFITKDGYVVMTAVQAFLRYNAEGEKEGFWLFVIHCSFTFQCFLVAVCFCIVGCSSCGFSPSFLC